MSGKLQKRVLLVNFGTFGDFCQGQELMNSLLALGVQVDHMGPDNFRFNESKEHSFTPLLPAQAIEDALKYAFTFSTVSERTGHFIRNISNNLMDVPSKISNVLQTTHYDLVLIHYFYLYCLQDLQKKIESKTKLGIFHLTPAPLDDINTNCGRIPNLVSLPIDRIFDCSTVTLPKHWHLSHSWLPEKQVPFSSVSTFDEVNLRPGGLIVVSLGSFASFVDRDYLQVILNVLSELDQQVIIDGNWGMKAPSPNITFVSGVPHSELFNHCSLLVTHCSAGVVMKALKLGLKMVCLPQFADQEMLAQACWVRGNAVGVIKPQFFSQQRFSDLIQRSLETIDDIDPLDLSDYPTVADAAKVVFAFIDQSLEA